MKLCFNEGTSILCSNLEKDLILCDQNGFDYIEIHTPKLIEYLKTHTIADLKEFFDTHHLKPYAFNSLKRVTFRDEDVWTQFNKEMDLFCEVGRAIGCDLLVTVPSATSDVDFKGKTRTEIRSETINAMRRIDEYCRSKGWPMRIALEFVGLGYPGIFSVNDFGEACRIVDEADMDNLGLVLDTYHFFGMGSDFEDLKKADTNKIFDLHINDSDDLPRGFWSDMDRKWPGDGYMDLKTFFTILKEKRWDKMASIEVFRQEYFDLGAELNIKTAYEKTVQILSPYWDVR